MSDTKTSPDAPAEQTTEQLSNVMTSLNKLSDRLDSWMKEGKELVLLSKYMRKEYVKEVKQYNKSKKRRTNRDSDTPRKPSGFGLPTAITHELADFLGLNHDERIPRTRVTSLITEYVKKHDLQDQENKKQINLNLESESSVALKNLLNPDKYLPGKSVTFFNLQTLLKWHFPESKSVIESKELELAKLKSDSIEPEPEPVSVPVEPIKKTRRTRKQA